MRGIVGGIWLAWVFLWPTIVVAHRTNFCETILQTSGSVPKFLRQIDQLNPLLLEDFAEAPTFESLFLLLKNEEWKYAAIPHSAIPKLKPLPLILKLHLQHEFGHSHDLLIDDEVEMTRFYVNSLRGLYSRLGEALRTSRVQSRFSDPLNFSERHILESVYDSFWTPQKFSDPALSPESARLLFEATEWLTFNWVQAREFAKIWPPFATYSMREFYSWLSSQPQLEGLLSDKDLDRLAKGFDRVSYSQAPICCASTPGCHLCPLNRRTLKKN